MGTAALLTIAALIVPTSTASADGCKVINSVSPTVMLCGRVYNQSTKPLYTTTVLDFPDADEDEARDGGKDDPPHECELWNGEGNSSPATRKVGCYQVELAPGSSRGGNYVDVDAFTYADREYLIDFHGKLSWQTEGVWTRIRSWESAYCYTDPGFGFPTCLIKYL
ncbi:hypothetical protein [Actinophytocola sp. KF-1]